MRLFASWPMGPLEAARLIFGRGRIIGVANDRQQLKEMDIIQINILTICIFMHRIIRNRG